MQRWSLFPPMQDSSAPDPARWGSASSSSCSMETSSHLISKLSPKGHRVLGGGSAAAPRSQPLPAQVEGQRDPSSPTLTKWGCPQREELPLPPRCPSPPRHPRECSPTSSPPPNSHSQAAPLSPPPSHPQLCRPLPAPPHFPTSRTHPRLPGKVGGGAEARGPLPTHGRGGLPGAPAAAVAGGAHPAAPASPLAARLPVPRRPTPDGSGRPCGVYVALGGRGSANERGEGCRCQWRAGRWGCAQLIYCPKLQWKHGRAAPGDTEPKYDGGTR